MFKAKENKIVQETEIPLEDAVNLLTQIKQKKVQLERTLNEVKDREQLIKLIRLCQPQARIALEHFISIQSKGTWTIQNIKKDIDKVNMTIEKAENDISQLQKAIDESSNFNKLVDQK